MVQVLPHYGLFAELLGLVSNRGQGKRRGKNVPSSSLENPGESPELV